VAQRINVKGTSGSGKTTFARELARRLDLPYVELDALHHGPNWSEPTDEEFRARVRAAMDAAPAGWVIDGNYETKLGDTVLAEADLIVWLDLPLWLKLRRIWRRTKHRIRDDVELWSGNRESWRNALWGWDSLFWWMVRAHARQRREWPRRFAGDPRLVRLRSVEEARRWLRNRLEPERRREDDQPGNPPTRKARMKGEGTMTLGEFLDWLSDPHHLKKFLKNPERTMAQQGVSEEDRNHVLNGDAEAFRNELREEGRRDLADSVLYIVHPGNPPIVHP
jgi:adenylate kinase family enzyme